MLYTMLFIVIAVIIFFYMSYVKLIKNRNSVREALSGIDVQLKKRSNLIPNILMLAEKFMSHEKKLLIEITELRTRVNRPYDIESEKEVLSHFTAANELAASMGKLMISVENYPELKSDNAIVQAQQSYNEVEAKIAAARRFYNSSVTQLNNSVEIFPGSIVAHHLNIKQKPYYEVDGAAKAQVIVTNYL